MRAGTVTLLEVPMASRVRWIRAGYEHFETTETERLVQKLQKLIPKVGREKVREWEAWVERENWDAFVEDILVNHYDTAYALAAARSGRDDEAAEFLMLPDTEDETYAARRRRSSSGSGTLRGRRWSIQSRRNPPRRRPPPPRLHDDARFARRV